jgi:hypothetical protein
MKSDHFVIGPSGDLLPDVTIDLATYLITSGSWTSRSPDHPIAESPDRL